MSKKKKEKVVYYDDGSTISDMSMVNRKGEKRASPPPRQTSTAREKWRTYWKAVGSMLVPMCVVLLILGFLYLFMMLVTGNLF